MSDSYLKDPIGPKHYLNEMPSGLVHCADSQGGDNRFGRFIVRMGSAGSPLDSPQYERSGYMGTVPDIQKKFLKRGQR